MAGVAGVKGVKLSSREIRVQKVRTKEHSRESYRRSKTSVSFQGCEDSKARYLTR